MLHRYAGRGCAGTGMSERDGDDDRPTAARRAAAVPDHVPGDARRPDRALGDRDGLSSLARERVSVPGWGAPRSWHTAGHAVFTASRTTGRPVVPPDRGRRLRVDDGSAAFFPLYPLVVRAVSWLVGGHPLAGVVARVQPRLLRRAAGPVRPHGPRVRRARRAADHRLHLDLPHRVLLPRAVQRIAVPAADPRRVPASAPRSVGDRRARGRARGAHTQRGDRPGACALAAMALEQWRRTAADCGRGWSPSAAVVLGPLLVPGVVGASRTRTRLGTARRPGELATRRRLPITTLWHAARSRVPRRRRRTRGTGSSTSCWCGVRRRRR